MDFLEWLTRGWGPREKEEPIDVPATIPIRHNQVMPTADQIRAAKINELKAIDPERVALVPRMPDYTTPLTGWRAWQVRNKQLYSLGTRQYWRPRKALEAFCVYGGGYEDETDGHPSPEFSCGCGYWSFKTVDILTEALEHYSDVSVVGSVEIWGRVIECENGFRSQFAYPKELWLLKPGLEYLSWTYGVPVRKEKIQ